MPDDKAWLAIWRDIGESEPTYVVWLNKHTAEENVAEGIATLAKQQLDDLYEWDEEYNARLKAIIKAAEKKDWNTVIADWDEWRSDMGPLDNDVEMIEVSLGT